MQPGGFLRAQSVPPLCQPITNIWVVAMHMDSIESRNGLDYVCFSFFTMLLTYFTCKDLLLFRMELVRRCRKATWSVMQCRWSPER